MVTKYQLHVLVMNYFITNSVSPKKTITPDDVSNITLQIGTMVLRKVTDHTISDTDIYNYVSSLCNKYGIDYNKGYKYFSQCYKPFVQYCNENIHIQGVDVGKAIGNAIGNFFGGLLGGILKNILPLFLIVLVAIYLTRYATTKPIK